MRYRFITFLVACAALTGVVTVDAPMSAATRVAATATPAPDQCGERLAKDDGTWWECSFVDNFSGTALDPGKWIAQDSSIWGVTNGPAGCFVNKPWNIQVADGRLRLTARKLRTEFLCRSPLGAFRTKLASTTVTTRDRFSQAYGRFEVRARMPKTRAPGSHSAIWMFPNRQTYGHWPASGEIDIAEWFSARPDQVYPSVHYVGETGNTHTGHDGVVPNVNDFHTYGVTWTPTTMKFYYDGTLVYEHSWTDLVKAPLVASQPFDKPFNVVLGQLWGQLWNAPTAETPNAHQLVVDWVRVWK